MKICLFVLCLCCIWIQRVCSQNPIGQFPMYVILNYDDGEQMNSTLCTLNYENGTLTPIPQTEGAGNGQMLGVSPWSFRKRQAKQPTVFYAIHQSNTQSLDLVSFDINTWKKYPTVHWGSKSNGMVFTCPYDPGNWEIWGASQDTSSQRSIVYGLDLTINETLVPISTIKSPVPNYPHLLGFDIVNSKYATKKYSLMKISQADGSYQKLPVWRFQDGSGFVSFMWHPYDKTLLFVQVDADSETTNIYQIDPSTGNDTPWMSFKVKDATQMSCQSYDYKNTLWYLGCNPIYIINLKQGELLQSIQVQLSENNYVGGYSLFIPSI